MKNIWVPESIYKIKPLLSFAASIYILTSSTNVAFTIVGVLLGVYSAYISWMRLSWRGTGQATE